MKTKKELLQKIQKYVKENGGKTPGEETFYEYAEINIIIIRKLGWTKYSELVQEAGLIPNIFDNTKYTSNQLCELFIRAIREKGKWPTRSELDVKHYSDSNFPDSSTFYNKLGLTRDLAKTILEYIEEKTGYDDIINICNPVFGKVKNEGKNFEEEKVDNGFVYLGKRGKNYRIGRAKNIDQRRNDHNLNQIEYFDYIHIIKTDDMVHIEEYWHRRFSSKRIKGEWFKLSPSDVKAFKRWKRIF